MMCWRTEMTFGSLFAGIGGFDLGLERAGMTGLWQVEIDDYCSRGDIMKNPLAIYFNIWKYTYGIYLNPKCRKVDIRPYRMVTR